MAQKKKKKKVVKIKVKNVIILLSILLAIIGLFYYALTMPVKNIYIKGNEIITDYEIMKQASLDTYPSFILTKKSYLKNTLLKNSYIKDAKVTKKLGNIINLDITEYQRIALTTDNKIILSNGAILENNYNLSDIPILINGINTKEIHLDFALKFSKVDKNILRQISQIEYSPVEVDAERFLLYMNDGNLVYITLTKIEKLNKYNGIKDKLNDKKGIIYIDSGDYVELKKEVQPNNLDQPAQ